jgi:hypothetical protein
MKLNRLLFLVLLSWIGVLFAHSHFASATLVKSCSLPQLCRPESKEFFRYLDDNRLKAPLILASAECLSPAKTSEAIRELHGIESYGNLLSNIASTFKSIEKIDLSLSQAVELEDVKETSEFQVNYENKLVFDTFLNELPKSAQSIILRQMPYVTPSQLEKMVSKINEGIKGIPLTSDLDESYQSARRDIIFDVILKKIGKNMVQISAQRAADETGKMIAYRTLNPESYRYIALGFPTKPMAVKGKSAQGSLIGGLIPVDAKYSKSAGKPDQEKYTQLNRELLSKNPEFEMVHLTRDFNGVTQTAVFKEVTLDGKKSIIEQWKSDLDLLNSPDEWIKYELIGKKVKDEQGKTEVKPITADVDLAFVGKQKDDNQETEPVYYHETKGYVTQTENRVLKAYNKNARGIGVVHDLVNHGSQANDPSDAELEGKVIIAIPNGKFLSKVRSQSEATKFATEGGGRKFSVEGSNLKGMGSMIIPVERTLSPLPPSISEESIQSLIHAQ